MSTQSRQFCDSYITQFKNMIQYFSDMGSVSRAKEIFRKEYFNEEENQRYNLSRHYIGTRLATVMALYNLFVIRQKILKNAIYITKSNNPTVVKLASVGVGTCYLVGLFAVWLIPSFATESAVRTYYGCESATMAYMLTGKQLVSRVFNQKRRKDLLKRQNIGVKNSSQ